jgi:predicted dehydrogenase
MVIAALDAGKHVLCEKPLATTAADAEAVLAAERKSGKQLMVVQNLRYDEGVLGLRRHLDECPLGEVYYGRCQWLRRRRLPARPGFTQRRLSGGGPLLDLGVHVIDLACWLTGWPAVAHVDGITSNRLTKRSDLGSEWGQWDPKTTDTEDFAAGFIRFANGAALALETSWLLFQTAGETWHLELFGDRAGITWPEGRRASESDRRPWDAQLALPRPNPQHAPLIRDFAEALVHDRPVPIPSWQSAYVVAILDALYRSAATGHSEPVQHFGRPA